MKKGLFSKMVATFTAIITVSFVVTAAFLSLWFESYYFNQRKNQLMAESQLIGPAAVQYIDNSISAEKLQDMLNYLGKYLSANIWLVDRYGYTYAISNPNDKSQNINQMAASDLEELRLGHIVEKKGTYGGMFTVPVHTLEIPVFAEESSHKGLFKGAIVMHTSIGEIQGPLKKVYLIIWISAILAIVGSCVVIYYFSQRIIIKPLAKINYVANKISQGEVDKRVDVIANDEIGELATSFNYMADSIEQIEKNRREFISNVSHEIRSPITSIKGFISGIIDGVIPQEKEKYYLSIAYDEIQRLTRLINDLLDLSAIEAGQFKLDMRDVDINEIIRISVIKFEPKIKEKKLRVDVLLEGDNLYVRADKDRITQVVTNLLDNAIKYVENGGIVKVCTRIKGDRALVSVFNDGPNIGGEDLKHIWDRFYKSDKSRSNKVSTGLGLPIVRSILTQHGEDIWVDNKQYDGVTFRFTLKLTK